jgi:hypothetical protein
MPSITYVGPFDAVHVPALAAEVRKNESVEADTDTAKSLLEQGDNWKPAKAATKKES